MNFSILTILIVLTEYVFDGTLKNLIKLLEFMTKDIASDDWGFFEYIEVCKKEILKQHPSFKEFAEMGIVDRSNYWEIGNQAIAKYGETLFVRPIKCRQGSPVIPVGLTGENVLNPDSSSHLASGSPMLSAILSQCTSHDPVE